MFDCTESEFGDRVGRVLRVHETLEPDFENRLMTEVRKAGPLNGRVGKLRTVIDWGTEERSVHLSPLAGLAMAAGFAGIIALSTIKMMNNRAHSQPVEIAQDGKMVQFVVAAPTASRVTLVGDFNNWDTNAMPLGRASSAGVWVINVPLSPGRHEYAFVVDGERWMADPASPTSMEDDFGKPSSVVTVGMTGERSA